MKRIFQAYRGPVGLAVYFLLAGLSFLFDFKPGQAIHANFVQFFLEMLAFIPPLFVIVGLFDAWVPREKLEQHIGDKSGIKGILVVILLAMLQAGPLYGAFPVAQILYKKGASVKNIFIYLGAFASLKIPMLGVEMGYLGIRFTLARTLVSLPLFILIGCFMEWYLKGRNFKVNDV